MHQSNWEDMRNLCNQNISYTVLWLVIVMYEYVRMYEYGGKYRFDVSKYGTFGFKVQDMI